MLNTETWTRANQAEKLAVRQVSGKVNRAVAVMNGSDSKSAHQITCQLPSRRESVAPSA